MRYGVIADVHGNAYALQAALSRLARIGVDGLLCAGDIVGYGPQPNECVELLAERGALCVAGNHELLVLGQLPLNEAGRLARETTPWTRSVLHPDNLEYLAGLPTTLQLPGVVMAHACLTDTRTYVRSQQQAAQQLRLLRELDPSAWSLLLGHTHRPWLWHETAGTIPANGTGPTPLPETGRSLLNPGSVGQSREAEPHPHARFLLLDTERRQVTFFAEEYDTDAARSELRRNRLPRACIHVRPGAWHAVPRRAGSLMRAARRHVRG